MELRDKNINTLVIAERGMGKSHILDNLQGDNLLRIETQNILIKRRITKIPDSIDKYFVWRDFLIAQKRFNDSSLEFGMAKFFLKTIPRGK